MKLKDNEGGVYAGFGVGGEEGAQLICVNKSVYRLIRLTGHLLQAGLKVKLGVATLGQNVDN